MAAPIRKSREASEAAQTGWSLTETVSVNDHPVRSVKEASQHLLDVASTPPHEEGNLAHCNPWPIPIDGAKSYSPFFDAIVFKTSE